MQKIILSVITIFILTSCGKYIEPKVNENTSLLILKDKKDGKCITYSNVKIDNKVIDRYNSGIKKIRVTPRKHTININSTIYYGSIAKQAELENFTINFKQNHVYTISLVPHTLKLKKDDDNVTGTYRVFENKKLILKKDLSFKNRVLHSVNEKDVKNGMDPMVIDSIIYSVILNTGL